MLKLHDALGASATSNAFRCDYGDFVNVLIVGTWDSNTVQVEVSPDPVREAYADLYQDTLAVTLTSTNNMATLCLSGGTYVRFSTGAGASTDLNIWVSPEGVELVSGEVA